MAETPTDREPSEPGSGLRLPRGVTTALRAELSTVAEQVVATVIAEVPSYSEPFRGRMGRNIENAVEIALGGFLELAASRRGFDHTTRVESVLEAAYALGRGEARAGRSMDALASAYRVGARTAWHDLSGAAVRAGLPAEDTAHFAELVFDYIDQLSLASVSGHADELATTGRIREQRRERLAQRILAGADPDDLAAVAERAEWTPPRTLTAVLLPTSMAGSARALLDERTLAAGDDAPGMDTVDREEDLAVLLVPDVDGPAARAALLQGLRARDAVVGPARPWERAALSLQRAVQARALPRADPEARTPVDSEEHLADLVLAASPDVLDDLRDRVLAPLAELRPAAAEKLTATLRSWLLHHGRRDDVAAELFVHPQTVRYRMGQLRELYGDRLEDPRTVLELTIALARLPGSGPDANGPVTS